MSKAHKLVYPSTLGLRVIKKKGASESKGWRGSQPALDPWLARFNLFLLGSGAGGCHPPRCPPTLVFFFSITLKPRVEGYTSL